MAANRRRSLRGGLYALILLAGFAAWLPSLVRSARRWQEAWRMRRDICILYTTETRGYLDNCMCEHAVTGSLQARQTYLREQRRLRPHLLLVDTGDAVEDTRRMGVTHTAIAMGAYSAIGTGPEEAKLGETFVRSAREHRLPLVRAVPRGDAADALAQPLRVFRLAGHAVGITAAAPPPEGRPYEEYRGDLVAAMRALRPRCEVLVLLSQLGVKRDRELARRCGEAAPHLIIGNAEAGALSEPERIGGTTLIPTAPGGMRVGSVDLSFPWWGPPRVGKVSRHIAEGTPDPTLERMVKAYYQTAQTEFVRGTDPALLSAGMVTGAGDVLRCGKCHPHQAEHWRGTFHSRAMVALVRARRVVPECVVCHATHYRDTGVFDRRARAGSVDCTGCHPVAGERESSRCPQKATRTRGAATCVRCHNTLHNPTFRYLEKLPLVDHSQRSGR